MKTIIITGASGGIGSEIAKKFATKSNNLILIYNSNKKNIETLKAHLQNKTNVDIFKCDLSQTNEIDCMVNKVINKYKRIDYLINCAGVDKFLQIQDTTELDYSFIMDNNLKSTVMLTAKVSQFMISEKFGKIINISSIWGNTGASMESLYSASKGAINAFTLSLAKELGPSNINVNAICPGWIDTKMNAGLSEETKQEIINETPLQRIGYPKDVANLCEFLCSEKANFITGQLITIDGGLTL